MPRVVKIFLVLFIIVAAFIFSLREIVPLVSPRPDNLGVENGRLAPCPASPNCVSSQAEDEPHAIAPLTYTGDTAVAHDKLTALITADPQAVLITNQPNYIHAEYRTRFWHFIDDVEFFIDTNTQTIHMRSASRLGYGDLNANRTRMEQIRTLFVGE
ncbi:MAG: DUF1499 domain-containing protein [Candidatus Promineifilaceae bacterium]